MIGFATLASSGNEVANEVFVVPDVVPTLAATPTATVGPATASPEPSPDVVLEWVGSGETEAVADDPAISEPDEPSVEGLAGPARVDGSVESDFFAGYRDGGGIYGEDHIWRVIDCESLWNPLAGTRHLGLAQFSPGTWANVSGRTGLTDWASPYHQGFNVAVWSQLVNPGSTAGWPVCWHV